MSNNKIKTDLTQMFWEPAIDYANSIEAITFETDVEIQAQQERWDKVHKAYSKGVQDVIEFISSNYELKLLVEPLYDKVERSKQNAIEYNDMCARATLYPGKTIEEVKKIQLTKRIEDTYNFINGILCNNTLTNTPETRRYVVDMIQKKMDYGVIVKCNEENNPPELVDQNLLIAELFWNLPYDTKGPAIQKSTLIFGDKAAVEKYQFSWMIDNESFKFIQKGI